MTSINGKVVLITGAGRGQGRQLALALAAQGALLALNDISPINVDEVAREIAANGQGQARVYIHDVAKKVAVQALINQVLDDFGHLDILINNANVQPSAGLLEMDEWDLHRVFEVNTIGAFLVMQSAARVMREQGNGLIVNLLGSFGPSSPPAYSSSRLAVAGLTRQIASELAAHGIRVYGLAHGLGFPDASAPAFPDESQAVEALCASRDIAPGSILRLSA